MKTKRKFLTKTFGVIAAAAVLRAAAAFSAEVSQIPDARITTALEERLIGDPDVHLPRVDVTVESGVATLSGTVDSLLDKERAEQIAGAVRGVRAVNNELAVNPPPRDAGAIKSDIEEALKADPSVSGVKLAVLVKNGVVTIGGSVEKKQDKETVLDVVRGVRGVQGIQDNIRVLKYEERPDTEIAEDVRNVLAADPLVSAGRIEVQVKDAHVILGGEVGSVAEKARATMLADVAGVWHVNAKELEVNPALPDTTRPEATTAANEGELLEAVNRALRRQPRVASFVVDVDVDGTVVTLSGVVDNLAAERAAVRATRDTRGVTKVVNQLSVRPVTVPANEDLGADVKAALNRDPYLFDETIEIRTSLGIVNLDGKVDSQFLKQRAEDVVSRVRGVVTISNGLEVRNPRPASRKTKAQPRSGALLRDSSRGGFTLIAAAVSNRDSQIRKAVEEKLRAHPVVHFKRINVHVLDGVATLTGNVRSVSELNAAIQSAREGGAIDVRNNIRVKADPKDVPFEKIEKAKP